MEGLPARPRFRFSMLFLLVLVTGVGLWFGGYKIGFRSGTEHGKDLAEQPKRVAIPRSQRAVYPKTYAVADLVDYPPWHEAPSGKGVSFESLIQQLHVAAKQQLDEKAAQRITVQSYVGTMSLLVSAGDDAHEVAAEFLRAKRMELHADVQPDGGQ